MKFLSNSPYDKHGGKPDFVIDIEKQNIYGLRNIWNFLFYEYKDKEDKSIVKFDGAARHPE